jgi:hypothetical protein
MKAATILGVGAITHLGRDLATFAQKLAEDPVTYTSYPVDDRLLSDPAINRRMRRADRFSKMAAIAANDAWNQARQDMPMDRVGLIIASGLGPYLRTFRFLDGILDGGDTNASPTDFSHSVHGAAAAYITELLDIRGPGLTVTDFENSFEQCIQLAQCWLASGTCDRVLVGAVEELGDLLIHCASRLDGHLTPGEGAVFFVLGPSDLPGLAHLDATGLSSRADMQIADDPPILPVKKALQPTTTFTPYFGHLATTSAFQILGGLLSFTAGRWLGKCHAEASRAPVDSAATFKPLWHSTSATLTLIKQPHK